MAVYLTKNTVAREEYTIPVSWSVCSVVKVQANSLQEAIEYAQNHLDEIGIDPDGEYIEDSLEIDDSIDVCRALNSGTDIICENFSCDTDLSQYVSSILFDSDTNIASGTFSKGDSRVEISLDIQGAVSVYFRGERYFRPSEFPEELRELIRNHPDDWDVCAPSGEGNDDYDIYVGLNNWFEYITDSGGVIEEGDISKMSPEDILETMKEIARDHFKAENAA